MDFTERLELYKEGGMIDDNDIADVNAILDLFKKNYGVTLSEENAGTFIAHICAAYGRLKTGEPVETLPEAVESELKSLDTYPESVRILNQVMEATRNPLNKTEQGYALLHINNLIGQFKAAGQWPAGGKN